MTTDGPQYLSLPQVTARYSCSRATVYRLIQNKQMPAPCKIGGMSRWALSDLRAWECDLPRAPLGEHTVNSRISSV